MTNNTNLPNVIIKTLALMQYNSESFFICEDVAYIGNKEDAEQEYKGSEMANTDSFSNWCQANLEEVAEYDEDADNDYLVLTDKEADEKAAKYIKDSLWAFNAEFLAAQTDLPVEVFTAIIENGKCESNNDVMEQIINKSGDMEEFISSAISADGRGHFMSSYDGNENEESINVEGERFTFYIYRIN